MTREEAIRRVKGYLTDCLPSDCYEEVEEIIKALEQEPTTKNDLGVDLISREQAKTAIRDKFKDLPSRVEINTILNELPSVTPQLSVPEITALAEWITKLTEANKSAYSQGYADGMKAQAEPKTKIEESNFSKDQYVADINTARECGYDVGRGDKKRVFDKIREQIKSHLRGVEITLEVLVENDPLRPKMEGAKDTLEECLEIINKAEQEE